MRRQSSNAIHASYSYSLSRDDSGAFSGMVVTAHGIVSVHGEFPNVHSPSGTRSFSMAYQGRMYYRYEDAAQIYSSKHGAVLAGKFARDVAAGRIG